MSDPQMGKSPFQIKNRGMKVDEMEMTRYPNRPESFSGERWYAVHTLPHVEHVASIHLRRQGFETFLPKIVVTRRHARRFQTRQEALFPRYEFVRLDLARHRWRSINGTTGVASVVMSGDLPSAVRQGLVEDLMACADETGVLDIEHGFSSGDSVRVVAGPMAGMVGTLVSLNPGGRVEILMSLFTGSVPVNVARDMLRPAS